MIASKHLQFVVVLLGCLLAIYVGSNIVDLPIPVLFILGGVILLGTWMLVAGENWWFLIFTGATVGGIMHLGFKVYPHELTFALAVVGLLPLVLTQDLKVFQTGRKPLPAIFYITGFYLTIRLLVDVVPALGYRGSLGRIAFDTAWPFIFIFLFHHYGSLDVMKKALAVMFGVLLVRTLAAIAGYILDIPLVVPGLNYYLSVSAGDSLIPMRYVAAGLLTVTVVLFHCAKSIIWKILLIPVAIFAIVLVAMGEGRFPLFVILLLPFAFLMWSRRWIPLFIVGVVGFASLAYINVAPQSLLYLPHEVGRAMSGMVFTSNAGQDEFQTGGSDEWHDAMRQEGFHRWLANPATFLFGDGIKPSPDFFSGMKTGADMQVTVKNAANIGVYENGLCATVAVVGAVGFVLNLLFFIRMGRDIVPKLMRRPRGTLWEGIAFWGVYSAIIWYVSCYFQGGQQGFETIIICLAWEAVNEGRLDEKPEDQLPQEGAFQRRGSAGLPIALAPATARP